METRSSRSRPRQVIVQIRITTLNQEATRCRRSPRPCCRPPPRTLRIPHPTSLAEQLGGAAHDHTGIAVAPGDADPVEVFEHLDRQLRPIPERSLKAAAVELRSADSPASVAATSANCAASRAGRTGSARPGRPGRSARPASETGSSFRAPCLNAAASSRTRGGRRPIGREQRPHPFPEPFVVAVEPRLMLRQP